LTSSGFTIPTAFRRVRRAGIAFGAERLAFIPFRNPVATVLVALVLAVLAVVGIHRIKTDDSLSQLFRSQDPA